MKKFLTTFVISTLFLTSFAVQAEEMLKRDPKRPVDKISRDLNVTQDQFLNCFDNVNPAPNGQHTTLSRVKSNKEVLLSCLQKANPNITNDSLDVVMDKYRPGGRAAQEPVN